MSEETQLNIDALERALAEGDVELIRELAEPLHPADLAAVYADLEEETQQRLLIEILGSERFAQVLRDIPAELIEETLEYLDAPQLTKVLESVSDDVRVDILQELEPETRARYLDLLAEEDQELTANLLKFDWNTAGGRMTTAIGRLQSHMSVKEALRSLRQQDEEAEILSRIFVTDTRNRLVGRVRLRDLAFATWDTPLKELIEGDLISIEANADQEEAAALIKKYDLFALPVVDEFNHLLGAITHDDAMEILEEETSEDIERSAGISGETTEESYLNTPLFTHLKRRFPWLIVLAYMSIITGAVVYQFGGVLQNAFALTLFMPMVVAAGGNSGGQAATMIIRGLALREIDQADLWQVAKKEAWLGLFLGLLLGLSIIIVIYAILPFFGITMPNGISHSQFAIAVAFSMTAQIASSTLIGGLLPLVARAFRLDPAVIASPVITTVVDISGMLIYFGAAKLILQL